MSSTTYQRREWTEAEDKQLLEGFSSLPELSKTLNLPIGVVKRRLVFIAKRLSREGKTDQEVLALTGISLRRNFERRDPQLQLLTEIRDLLRTLTTQLSSRQ